MSMIQVKNLSFAYDGNPDPVFEHVSFRIDTDWKLGFTGRNGRGKTTFLQLLMGQYEYTGTIDTSMTFEYFPCLVKDREQNTIDILHEISLDCADWEIYRELSLLEVDDDVLYRPFSTLSNGEQTKILLSALFLKQNAFLLIDEPTNHLDENARRAIGSYLNRKKGFILVSHDRELLDLCVDHILSINKTNIEIQKGNFSSWWENKQQQDAFEAAQNEKLKREISRLSSAARRTAGWSDQVEKSKYHSGPVDRGFVGHKSAKMMKRAKSIETRRQTALEEKAGLLHNIETEESLSVFPISYHSSRLIQLDRVSLFYDQKQVCSDVSFTIHQGDRIALCGKNGCGKSSILKLICGDAIFYQGELFRASGLKISYVPQDTSQLKGTLSQYAQSLGVEESTLKTLLRKMDFSRAQFEKDLSDYSAGQKKKVLLAGSLSEQAHLYIWDEPLNYIDVISRMQIEQLLLRFCPTLLFVEHDLAFSRNVATQQVTL